MKTPPSNHITDLRGGSRLAVDAVTGITDLVQALHGTIARVPGGLGGPRVGRALPRRGLPLPADVQCFTVAATPGTPDDPVRHTLLGDGLVPVPSALGEHRNPRLALSFLPQHCWIAHGCNHLDLLSSAEVCQRLRAWPVAQT